MPVQPKLSVIIVSYFVRDEVRDCLTQLRQTSIPMEVFVVDNASTDGTREMIEEEFSDWDALIPTYLEENVGLAEANNVPIPKVTGEYVLILNPDTIPTEESLARLCRYLDGHPDVGVVGPKQLYGNGVPHSSFHLGWGLGHILLWSTVPRSVLQRWYDHPKRLVHRDVLFVSGACLLIRADLYRAIGGYDPHLFLAVEDAADLCRRVLQTGHRVVYYPEAELIHYGARSNSHAKAFSLLKGSQGHLYYMKKWHGSVGFAGTYSALVLNSALRAAVYGVVGVVRPDRFMPFAKAHLFVIRNLHVGLPSTGRTQRALSAAGESGIPAVQGRGRGSLDSPAAQRSN